MTKEREAEIRRMACDHAARELNAVVNNWEIPQRLFTDEDERDEFELQVSRIVRRLENQAKRRPCPTS